MTIAALIIFAALSIWAFARHFRLAGVARLRLLEANASLARESEHAASRAMYLRFAARRFEALFHGLPAACFTFGEEGTIFEWNSAAERAFGIPSPDAVGQNIVALFAASDHRNCAQKLLDRILASDAVVNFEWSYGERWFLCHAETLAGVDGTPCGGVCSAIDISDRKQAEARLHESQLLARSGTWEYELDTNKSTWSKALFSLFRLDPEGPPRSLPQFLRAIHPEDRERVMGQVRESIRQGGQFTTHYRVTRGDGTLIHIQAVGETYIENGRPVRMLGSVQDVTERIETERRIEAYTAELEDANAKLEALATIDGLTGIKNHRVFQEFLESHFQRSLRYQSPLSLILLDVDSFKSYNDSFGHQAGDEVLRTIAKILSAEVRTPDMVARYGGEEFVVVLPNTALEAASALAERLRARIADETFPHRPVTASFGVSSVRLGMIDRATLILESDQALYLSKQNGKNRVTYFGSSGMPIKSIRLT